MVIRIYSLFAGLGYPIYNINWFELQCVGIFTRRVSDSVKNYGGLLTGDDGVVFDGSRNL